MLTTQQMQQIELDIMQKLHLYCQKHGLRYIMCYGTLLGAVRHKGFIPWDNDMDIYMPREDFERFLELSVKDPVAEHLYTTHYTLDSTYHYMCARVCDDQTEVEVPYIREKPSRLGVWVDVFPMDGVIQNPLKRTLQTMSLRFHWLLFRSDVYGFEKQKWTLRRVVKEIAIALMPNKNQRNNYRIDKICKKGSKGKCTGMEHIFETPRSYAGIPMEDIENAVLMDFEEYQFYGPKHYDEYLAAYYGDYMQLPPPEKRTVHEVEARKVEKNENE